MSANKLLFLFALLGMLPVLSFAQCLSGDCQNGVGTFQWDNGIKYAGDFQNGNANGTGEFTFPSGNTYYGNVSNGQQNGTGIFTWATGGQYIGGWKDGKKNGVGKMFYDDGTSFTIGVWKDDQLSWTKESKSSSTKKGKR